MSVEVSTSTGWLSDITTTQIALYQSRALLFDQCIGSIAYQAPNASFQTDEHFAKKAWWATVRNVTVEADSLKGVVYNATGYYPFVVIKPWSPESQPPAPPSKPAEAPVPPVDYDKVYTYVEEMPHLPGRPGKALRAELDQAIRPWFVLPRDAQEGRVWLSLEVNKAGGVRNLRIVKGLNANTDSAVLAAARQLPPFVPGRQNGHLVNVSVHVDFVVKKPRRVRTGLRSNR